MGKRGMGGIQAVAAPEQNTARSPADRQPDAHSTRTELYRGCARAAWQVIALRDAHTIARENMADRTRVPRLDLASDRGFGWLTGQHRVDGEHANAGEEAGKASVHRRAIKPHSSF